MSLRGAFVSYEAWTKSGTDEVIFLNICKGFNRLPHSTRNNLEKFPIFNVNFHRSYRTRLELMFGTENEGFCGLMKSFFGCIAIVTEAEKDKIRTRNAKFVGKRLT